jgi:hypothetical protein
MRTILVLALAAGALGLPSAVHAADLTFGIEGSAEYDSNVFRTSRDEDDDYLFRIRPSAKLHEDRGQDLSYSLQYALPVEFAVQDSDLNDVDQQLVGRATYHINDRFIVFGSDSFRYLRNELLTNFEGTDAAFDAPLVNDQRDRITLNEAALGTTYQFTPRLIGTLRAEHSYYDPSRDDRATTNDITGTGSMQYALTPQHKLGGGFQASWLNFDETQDIVASTAQSYSVFGSWDWAIDEKTGIALTAGPALIRNEQDDPDQIEFRQLVPSRRIGAFTAPGGLRDSSGGAILQGTPFPNGALLVGSIDTCALALDPNGTPVPVLSSGESCPLNIVLDPTPGADDQLIAAIENANATRVALTNLNPDGEESTDVTVFATATLRRDWTPTLRSALTYRRDQGTASGLGGTVVADSVSLSNVYDIAEKWQFALRGDWVLRQSVDQASRVIVQAEPLTSPLGGEAFGAPIAGVATDPLDTGVLFTQRAQETSIDTMRWGLAGRITHFLTRNTSGYLQLTYNQQTSESDSLGDPSDFDNYLVTLGVQHVFEPIKLW